MPISSRTTTKVLTMMMMTVPDKPGTSTISLNKTFITADYTSILIVPTALYTNSICTTVKQRQLIAYTLNIVQPYWLAGCSIYEVSEYSQRICKQRWTLLFGKCFGMYCTFFCEAQLPTSHVSIHVIPQYITNSPPDIAIADLNTSRLLITSLKSDITLPTDNCSVYSGILQRPQCG